MQVGHALIGVDIGDVGHPQLVDPVDGQSLDHVLVLPVRMVGACRVTALPGLQHQVWLVHQPVEPVPATHPVRIEFLEHQVQLVRPDARSLMPDIPHGVKYLFLWQFPAHAFLLAHGVITFSCLAKQPAQATDRFLGMPEPKVVYRLAPAFFSRSMPYCSRPILRSSCRASLRNSE